MLNCQVCGGSDFNVAIENVGVDKTSSLPIMVMASQLPANPSELLKEVAEAMGAVNQAYKCDHIVFKTNEAHDWFTYFTASLQAFLVHSKVPDESPEYDEETSQVA